MHPVACGRLAWASANRWLLAAVSSLFVACAQPGSIQVGGAGQIGTGDDDGVPPTVMIQDAGVPEADLVFPFANADLSGPWTTAPKPDLLVCADHDGDGVTNCDGDCDDENPDVHPGATEVCNGLDDNCDGRIDEGFDEDGDGWTTCAGDCNDSDPTIHPDARPICDGRDHNCNGKIDDLEDGDGDGWPSCQDCDDADPNVNPGAMEVVGDHIDNNCNGMVDETTPPCDGQLAFDSQNATDYAHALDLCTPQFFLGANFSAMADAHTHAIAPRYGMYKPQSGSSMIALSTGIAADENEPGYVAPQDGSAFLSSAPNPLPMGMNCGGIDPQTVYDYTELVLTLKVPTNARSFSFDFSFFSAEYPEWVCQAFNDKFLALLDSKAFKGNVSFDAKGNPVTVNNGFFTLTQPADLLGTGYEVWDPKHSAPAGAATGWLTTTAPVIPGETITLRFIVFDEGDHILDSAVLIDHFRWSLQPAQNGPQTIRTM